MYQIKPKLTLPVLVAKNLVALDLSIDLAMTLNLLGSWNKAYFLLYTRYDPDLFQIHFSIC